MEMSNRVWLISFVTIVALFTAQSFFAPVRSLQGRRSKGTQFSSTESSCLHKPSWVQAPTAAAFGGSVLHVSTVEPPTSRRVEDDDSNMDNQLKRVENRLHDASDQLREKAKKTRENVKSRMQNMRERVESATLSVRSDYIRPAVRLAQNPVSIQYGISMAIRLSYFMMQDGVISTTVDRRVSLNIPAVVRAVLGAIANGREEELLESLRIPDERLTSSASYAWWRKNLRGIITLLRKEASDIENGVFKFPLDMAPTRGEALSQANPAALIALSASYWLQQRQLKKDASMPANTPSDFIAPGRYPDYYLEGPNYLSATKAEVMDYEADSLLWGMADAVRRRSLAKIDAILADKDPENTKLLDVGCGSGRFLSFVKDNFKLLKVTAMDLSLFNLMKAKKVLKAYSGVTFLEGNAETMPLGTEAVDIVTCNFVLSEVPMEAQVSIINEMARILKPGGRLIIVDGTQTDFDQGSYSSGQSAGAAGSKTSNRGSGSSTSSSSGTLSTAVDGSDLCTMDGLPHFVRTASYDAYQRTDLEYLLIKAGLFIQDKEISWVSKMIVAQKPPLITPVIGDDQAANGVGY